MHSISKYICNEAHRLQILHRSSGIIKHIRTINNFASFDNGFEEDRIKKLPGEQNNRDYTYFILGNARFIYASVARLAVIKMIASMAPSADVLATSSEEYDISSIGKGTTITVKWRGKPVFIKHRTRDEIDSAENTNLMELRDPQSDRDRVQDPDWLIVVGICTHLGCVPISGSGDYNGWLCPCHGSHYDTSGRIRKGPGPGNLEIPPYTFLTKDTLLIGEE